MTGVEQDTWAVDATGVRVDGTHTIIFNDPFYGICVTVMFEPIDRKPRLAVNSLIVLTSRDGDAGIVGDQAVEAIAIVDIYPRIAVAVVKS
jgi:hypothetical protein